MQDPQAKEYFDNGWLEYLRHLPEDVVHSTEVQVLRGHILIERQLNRLIEGLLAKPSALDLGRMQFASKIRLAEALRGDNARPWLWEALKIANKLRNSLAHELDDNKLPGYITTFVEHIRRDDPLTFAVAGNELDSQLAYSLAWLHEELLNECIRTA